MLADLAAHTHQRSYAEGDTLCHQPDVAHTVWLTMSGWVKLTRETLDGSEAVWDVLGAGHLVGLETLMPDYRYTTRAVAVEPVTTLAISHAALRRITESHPPFALALLGHSLRQQESEQLEIEHRTHQTAPQRIGCFLLRLAKAPISGSMTLNLPFDKGLLAARLGMQPETFSRALARLKQDTGIGLQGAQVTIQDVAQMHKYVCGPCSGSYPCQPCNIEVGG